MDIVVENHLVIEVKSVEQFPPIHERQLLTYLKLSGPPLRLMMNFNAPMLKDGIRRRRV
jgi:GxxExxY protein